MRSIFFRKHMPRMVAAMALKPVWPGVIYSPIGPNAFRDLPEPALPGPQGIRLENIECGICASDLHILHVSGDPFVHPVALPGNDVIYLGHEVVSRVTDVGPDVTDVAVGDRVAMLSRFLGATCASQGIEPVCDPCIAGNYALCDNQQLGQGHPGVGGGWGDGYTAHQSEVWKVPDDLDDDQATLVEPLACGLRAVLRRPPEPGENVLVLGCGMIGLATVQAALAVQPDCNVFAAARYPQQIERAEAYGATVVNGDMFAVAEQRTGGKTYVGDFKNRTMLGGFDVIYDCVGNDQSVQQNLRICRAGGTVVVVGVYLYRMKADLTPVWHQEVSLLGAIGHGTEDWNDQDTLTYDLVAEFLRTGQMTADKLVTHRFALDDWRQAIQVASDKGSGSIKVVFEFE